MFDHNQMTKGKEFKVYGMGVSSLMAIIGGAFLVLGVVIWWLGVLDPESFHPGPPSLWFTLLWSGFSLFVILSSLRIPRTIRWCNDGSIVFTAPLRSVTLMAKNITRLRPAGQMIILRHTGGKIQLDRNYIGLHELVSLIEKENPNVDIRGI